MNIPQWNFLTLFHLLEKHSLTHMHLYFAFCWMDTKSLQSKFFSVADMTVADINVGETTKLLTLLNFLDGELRFQFSQFLKVERTDRQKRVEKTLVQVLVMVALLERYHISANLCGVLHYQYFEKIFMKSKQLV